jgi:hypothetical protein
VSAACIDELSNLIFDTTMENSGVNEGPVAYSFLTAPSARPLFKLIEKLAELG